MTGRCLAASLTILTIASVSTHGYQEPTPSETAETSGQRGQSDDTTTIDGILDALYDVISGPKGKPRDWERFRTLFAPEARLIPVIVRQDEPASIRVFSVDEFIETAGPAFDRDGFYETEIARRTDQFGHIAHIFSTYEARRAKDEEPFIRGINSIQLVNDGERWKVVTIFWDAERQGQPIPAEYLPRP